MGRKEEEAKSVELAFVGKLLASSKCLSRGHRDGERVPEPGLCEEIGKEAGVAGFG